ncbi:type II toxin-antitoxin system HicB family antitoxin [Aneurinibacillus aneurinilyticus]|uniref:type II toxin-antitoxin system HicB family antitoxin n=1 Tax=Aneurinibacillus aneurinilyticus TaxID=1391 RepID=UPI002E22EB35|nr:type II toxin-antitoxin system HicB family antitoxin [Aneurinibacillus aneurinilyticus]
MNKKDWYRYPAIFEYDDDGISISFPDLPGCLSCGDTEEEAVKMAKEALALHLYGLEQDKEDIPSPSHFQDIKPAPKQAIILVEVFMPPFRSNIENKAVKKTLTIPKWLDDLAQEHKVNYSHILQDALKEHLGVNNKRPE